MTDIKPVTINIDKSVLENIKQILVDQRDNCNELLETHDNSLGRTTKKNLNTAQMYENELDQIDWAIIYLGDTLNEQLIRTL